MKFTNIEDSVSDDEYNYYNSTLFIILHYEKWLYIWSINQYYINIFCSILYIYELQRIFMFSNSNLNKDIEEVVDLPGMAVFKSLMDFSLLVDIFICFFKSFLNDNEIVVCSNNLIAIKYLSGFFTLNFIIALHISFGINFDNQWVYYIL